MTFTTLHGAVVVVKLIIFLTIGFVLAVEVPPQCIDLVERQTLVRGEFPRVQYTHQERVVNHYILSVKQMEAHARDFFLTKFKFIPEQVKQTVAFQTLYDFPKGGLLHTHLSAMGNFSMIIDYIYDNEEILDKMFAAYCEPLPDQLNGKKAAAQKVVRDTTGAPDAISMFASAEDAAKNSDCVIKNRGCVWRRAKEMISREQMKQYSMMSTDDMNTDNNAEEIWTRFGAKFVFNNYLLYQPLFELFIKDALRFMALEGTSFVEMRSALNGVYYFSEDSTTRDFCGRPALDAVNVLRLIQRLVKETAEALPDQFIGGAFIYASSRKMVANGVQQMISQFKELKAMNEFKDFITGIDFVGEEDTGFSLREIFDASYTNTVPYILHGGETILPRDLTLHTLSGNQIAPPTDRNLYDAVAAKSKRLGHAVSLIRHPVLMERVRTEGICIETCPLSNHVLGYVKDLNAHPSIAYLANKLKVVISSDDPGIFGYNLLTFDYYAAFMYWGLSLNELKQITYDSIHCSTLPESLKSKAAHVWQKKYNAFIDTVYSRACNSEMKSGNMGFDTPSNDTYICTGSEQIQSTHSCAVSNLQMNIQYASTLFNFNFCDQVKCKFSHNQLTYTTEGIVSTPCKISCPVPDDIEQEGIYTVSILVNNIPICSSNDDGLCQSNLFVARNWQQQKEKTREDWKLFTAIAGGFAGVAMLSFIVMVVIQLVRNRNKRHDYDIINN